MDIKDIINETIDHEITNVQAAYDETQNEIYSLKNDLKALEQQKSNLEEKRQNLLNNLDTKDLEQCQSFTLSKSDTFELDDDTVNRANNWIRKHELQFHTKELLGFEHIYRGVSPCSRYEIVMGWTSLGRYVTLGCTECRQKFKYDSDPEDYSFTIEDLD